MKKYTLLNMVLHYAKDAEEIVFSIKSNYSITNS